MQLVTTMKAANMSKALFFTILPAWAVFFFWRFNLDIHSVLKQSTLVLCKRNTITWKHIWHYDVQTGSSLQEWKLRKLKLTSYLGNGGWATHLKCQHGSHLPQIGVNKNRIWNQHQHLAMFAILVANLSNPHKFSTRPCTKWFIAVSNTLAQFERYGCKFDVNGCEWLYKQIP